VVRKTGNVVIGLVAAKGIEHQKWVKPVLQILCEDAAELDACAIGCGLANDQALDRAGNDDWVSRCIVGHKGLLST
jgi:hypothetical protein